MEFTSHSQAQKKVESITGKSNVFFTNEGLEVNFTSSDQVTYINQVLSTLKETFSNVILTGKKIKTIKINAVAQEVINHRIIKVEY